MKRDYDFPGAGVYLQAGIVRDVEEPAYTPFHLPVRILEGPALQEREVALSVFRRELVRVREDVCPGNLVRILYVPDACQPDYGFPVAFGYYGIK